MTIFTILSNGQWHAKVTIDGKHYWAYGNSKMDAILNAYDKHREQA